MQVAKDFLAFAALRMSPTEREAAVERADFTRDAKLVRYEFLEMCVDLLWGIDSER